MQLKVGPYKINNCTSKYLRKIKFIESYHLGDIILLFYKKNLTLLTRRTYSIFPYCFVIAFIIRSVIMWRKQINHILG